MSSVELETEGCGDEFLELGQLVLFRAKPSVPGFELFPGATHLLFIDLLPKTPRGTTEFQAPTVTAKIKSGQNEDGFVRTFVPWKTNNAGTQADLNKHWPEVEVGSDWVPHLLPDSETFPKPTLVARLRRADGTLQFRGDVRTPNGVSFRFGLILKKNETIIDDVMIDFTGSFERAVAVADTCTWKSELSLDEHSTAERPGFVRGFFSNWPPTRMAE